VPDLGRTTLILAGIWAGFLTISWLISLLLRPRPVRPAPATPDLPAEPPPAVVNYLVHGCRVDPDAAVGTLVDLAARRYLELYQPGTDPEQILIRIRQRHVPGLAPYEQRVMDRVIAAAGTGNTVSLEELSHRYAEDGFQWSQRFAKEVAKDAKERKLAVDRWSDVALALLMGGTLISCATVIILPGRIEESAFGPDSEPLSTSGGVGLLVLAAVSAIVLFIAVLGILSKWFAGERRTAAGREATAGWLGVAAWLRAHDSFADLPTASVAVWDRYLAYGAAMGAVPEVSGAVDLAVGDRAVLWSTYGGRRRPVRVDYPSAGKRNGLPPPAIIVYGLLWFGVVGAGGYAIVQWGGRLPQLAVAGLALLGALLIGRAVYRISRAALDVARPVEVTGLVLSRTRLPRLAAFDDLDEIDATDVPSWIFRKPDRERMLAYVVVDAGTADTAPLWTVAPTGGNRRCQEGDIVRLTGYPWCRFVREITVLTPATKPSTPRRPQQTSRYHADPAHHQGRNRRQRHHRQK
jgi:hypothetical protein